MGNPAYNKKYNLRLPKELYERIEELGHTYDRSTNEQIVYMLRTWQEPSSIEERLMRLEAKVLPSPPEKAAGQ